MHQPAVPGQSSVWEYKIFPRGYGVTNAPVISMSFLRKLLPLLSLNKVGFEFLQHTSLKEIPFLETFYTHTRTHNTHQSISKILQKRKCIHFIITISHTLISNLDFILSRFLLFRISNSNIFSMCNSYPLRTIFHSNTLT